jgi:hypothetical protein
LIAAAQQMHEPVWPTPADAVAEKALHLGLTSTLSRLAFTQRRAEDDPAVLTDQALIRGTAVCIASNTWSAGRLGDTVLFAHQRQGNKLVVGYFVYWSAERPWGKNALTYSVLPALAIDAAYSHFLFVMPGVRELMYGPGDVEGAAVTYRVEDDGRLVPESALADDDRHHRITLSGKDLALGRDSIALMTAFWSHQLGAHGAATYAKTSGVERRCYRGESLRPLSDEVAAEFRLGTREAPRRARPAWLAVR